MTTSEGLNMMKYARMAIVLVIDMLIINFSYILAFLLHFDFDVDSAVFTMHFGVFNSNIFAITLIHLLALGALGVYASIWKYAGSREAINIIFGTALGSLAVLAYMAVTRQIIPGSIALGACIFIMLLIGSARFVYFLFQKLRTPGSFDNFVLRIGRKNIIGDRVTKVMIIGAGDTGSMIIKMIKQRSEYGRNVLVAIDDDPSKRGKKIHGVKIAGGREKIKHFSRVYGIDEIIIAMPSSGNKAIKTILEECSKTRCRIKVMPGFTELMDDKIPIKDFKDADIREMLQRQPLRLNTREISGYIEGNIVLVTGAGGQIGAELCRQIVRFNPRRIIALDIYEDMLAELKNEMENSYPQSEFEIVVGSVRDKCRLRILFERFKPHVVFHAAGYKNISLMEDNAGEVLINNIIGTKNLLDLSEEQIIRKFIMISSDRAASPAGVMGAAKRLCEIMLRDRSAGSQTSYCAVRFGDILGSNDAVISLIKKQIAARGPVTVESAEAVGYSMTTEEAVQLAIQAGAISSGGEVFLPYMGEPIKTIDLAESVIKLSGYVPNEHIDIVVSEPEANKEAASIFVPDTEGFEETAHEKIYVEKAPDSKPELLKMLTPGEATEFEEEVKRIAYSKPEEIKEWLSQMLSENKAE